MVPRGAASVFQQNTAPISIYMNAQDQEHQYQEQQCAREGVRDSSPSCG